MSLMFLRTFSVNVVLPDFVDPARMNEQGFLNLKSNIFQQLSVHISINTTTRKINPRNKKTSSNIVNYLTRILS